MKAVVLLLAALVALTAAQWVDPIEHHPHISDEKLAKLMTLPQALSREQSKPSFPFFLTWKNCGSASDPIVINTLSVTPDPIVLGGNVTAQASVTFKQPLDQSLLGSVSLVIAKKAFGFYLQIPCVDNLGSCTYNDLCTLLGSVSDKICPYLQPYGIPCKCPLAAGTYSFGPATIPIPNPGVSWLANGDYEVQATVKRADGSTLFCVQVFASLASK